MTKCLIWFWVSSSAHKSSSIKKGAGKSPSIKKDVNKFASIKKIECAVWETLSRARFADEKLAWGDNDGDSKDEMFYIPLGRPKRKALVSLLCHVLKPIYKLTHMYILPL